MQALSEPLMGQTAPVPAAPQPESQADKAKRKLLIGAGLCCTFMLAEIVGGIVSGSLAIVTDAAHMLSDVAGFLVGVIALVLTSREASEKYSFGFHRAEVLGALVSISIVWLMTGILLYEAVKRLFVPEVVDGKVMFFIALLGVGMNFVLMSVLGHSHGGHGHSHGGHGDCGGHGGHGVAKKEEHGHDHGHAHGDDCCGHDHAEEEHGHGHGHGEAKKEEHGHGHGHGHAEEEHGHGDDCCGHDHAEEAHGHGHGDVESHGHGHAEQEHHGHGHDEAGGCTHDHGHEEAHGHGHGHGKAAAAAAAPPPPPKPEKSENDMLVMRAAIAHVIGDILQSIGVCVAGALIWAFSDRWLDENGISYWYRVDPVCTFFFSILVMWSSVGTTQDAIHTLMAGSPHGVDMSDVEAQLRAIPNVLDVHCFHSWTLAGDKHNMMAHLSVRPGTDTTPVLYAAQRIAYAADCHHTCFQIEDVGTYDRVKAEGEGCYHPAVP